MQEKALFKKPWEIKGFFNRHILDFSESMLFLLETRAAEYFLVNSALQIEALIFRFIRNLKKAPFSMFGPLLKNIQNPL